MDVRGIPSVDAVLSSPQALELAARFARPALVAAIRHVLDVDRQSLLAGNGAAPPPDLAIDAIVARAERWLAARAPRGLARVVNATGVVLHTNLGRAPLAAEAIQAMSRAAADAVALEFDLVSGERGDRDAALSALLCDLTGGEAALAVNNNTAALLLALDTIAERREVVVSRGELIEIGGSFRLPDVLRKSGVVLREVGTTNRTRVEDFAAAIHRRTGAVLRVHPSNYRIEGFVEQPPLAALAALARERGVPLVEDLGSGALVDLTPYGLPREPTPTESLRAGADLVVFSGDKLLGGPQAGLAVGRAALVAAMQRNPLKRALRLDKLRLAALIATLEVYASARDLPAALPTLGLLCRSVSSLEALAAAAIESLRAALPAAFDLEVVASEAEIGSGAQPTVKLESRAIAVAHREWPPQRVAAFFRAADPAIVGRLARDRLLLDLRAVRSATDLVPHSGGECAG
jgi:L-seryl-tRNA(Ser) seleniumtransferase